MTAEGLATAIKQFAQERHYRAATVQEWLSLAPSDAAALYEIAVALRLGENQLRDLWEMAEDIAAREQTTIAAVLQAADIQQVLRARLSRNDRLQRAKHALRRRRFPELTAAEERARGLIQAAALPPAIHIALPPFLEGNEIVITCRATSPQELQAALAALSTWVGSAVCAELFALLGGEA